MYEFIATHTDILKHEIFWNPLNVKKVLEFNLELNSFLVANQFSESRMMAAIISTNQIGKKPHIDVTRYRYRLLWPVKNCEGSYTKFYDIDRSFFMLKRLADGTIYNDLKEEGDYPEIAAVELVRPIIFDSQIPHSVHVNPLHTSPRITFTIGFKEPPVHYLI